jgi:tetratricopeptide (TPR) repeat protein
VEDVMTKQVPFINRVEALRQIDEAIGEWGTRKIICIQALGGIGKSRLLQEVYQTYAGRAGGGNALLVADIIDFDDPAFYISLNLARKIAQTLDERTFAPYFQAFLDWRKMELAGVSSEGLARARLTVDQAFQACFNALASEKRILLLLDTTDRLEETDAWDYVLSLGLQLKNAVLLIAGRNTKEIYKSFEAQSDGLKLIELEPLQLPAAESYVEKKQELLHIRLDEELADKISLLARGKPILIDLAIEWLARNPPPDWLTEISLDELGRSGKEEAKMQEFERQLVGHIADARYADDWLILAMAQIYPLGEGMAAEILNISQRDADELIEKAQARAFIKALPDGRITLHDEVRRMINLYVWPGIDPQQDRRRWYSSLAKGYLQRQVEEIEDEIQRLDELCDVEGQEDLEAFMKRESLERRMWLLEGSRLHHALFCDVDEGLGIFKDVFDRASLTHQVQIHKTLLNEVKPYADALSPEQRYQVAIREAQHLFDTNQYYAAKEILLKMLSRNGISPLQTVETLLLLGNTEIRLGEQLAGVSRFKDANASVERIEDQTERLIKHAQVKNALGWGYRLLEKLDDAAKQYEAALDFAARVKDRNLTASILNNLGYVYFLRGQKDKGQTLCKQALEVATSSNSRQLSGWVNSTLGEIYLETGKYAGAIRHYESALKIFNEIFNKEGQAIVHMEISHAKRHRASTEARSDVERDILLEEALEHASLSVQLCEQYNMHINLPLTYYELGRVLLDLERFDEAESYLEKSYPVNKERGAFPLADLTALAEIAYRKKDGEKLRRWVGELDTLEESKRSDDLLFRGRLLRFLAEYQLERGEYDRALDNYVIALSNIVENGGYGAYRWGLEIDRLKKHIADLPDDQREAWCDGFVEKWQRDEERASEYSEVITIVQLSKSRIV